MSTCVECGSDCDHDYEANFTYSRTIHGKSIPITTWTSDVGGRKIVEGQWPKNPPQYGWIKVQYKTDDGTWKDSIGFENVSDAEEMWPDVEFREKTPWTRFWVGEK